MVQSVSMAPGDDGFELIGYTAPTMFNADARSKEGYVVYEVG